MAPLWPVVFQEVGQTAKTTDSNVALKLFFSFSFDALTKYSTSQVAVFRVLPKKSVFTEAEESASTSAFCALLIGDLARRVNQLRRPPCSYYSRGTLKISGVLSARLYRGCS